MGDPGGGCAGSCHGSSADEAEKDVKAWADEIRTSEVVEEMTGNQVTAESLHSAIVLINNKRRALSRLYDLRKNEKLPISGKDVLLISQIAFYDDPARFTEMTNKSAMSLSRE